MSWTPQPGPPGTPFTPLAFGPIHPSLKTMKISENDSALFEGPDTEERRAKKIENLVRSLSEIHGKVTASRGSSGKHLMLACPECYKNYGSRELRSRHLSINVDEHFNPSRVVKRSRRGRGKGVRGCALCHKCDRVYSVAELLSYPPQEGRRLGLVGGSLPGLNTDRYLVEDDAGVMVPAGPGKEIPISSLGESHPAALFLARRGYDRAMLYQQFAATFCEEEAPEGKEFGNRFYRRHSGGFSSTPQGRVIFYSRVGGSSVAWQGRYLDFKDGGQTWIWHPYQRSWVEEPAWDHRGGLIKYLTGKGCLCSRSLGGYDHVVQRARASGSDLVVLCEGPLDAARFPNHGLAVFGKSISAAQIRMIQFSFRRAILAFDTDAAGRSACKSAEAKLAEVGVKTARFFEGEAASSKTDVGDLDYAEAAERMNEIASTL